MAAVLVAGAVYGQAAIDWYTVDGGGGRSESANGLVLTGTLGQPEAGPAAGGELVLIGGFWGGSPPQVLFADRFESPPARASSAEEGNDEEE